MRIFMTLDELIERGLWEEYCRITQVEEWALAEGLMQDDESLELPEGLVNRVIGMEYRKRFEEG